MKAFEEYKKVKFGIENIQPDCTEAEAYLSGLGEGWRAALEEVLSHPGWGVDEESVYNSIVEELNNE